MLAIERFSINLDGITVIEPEWPVGENDEVIGQVPEELRPLYSLLSQVRDSHEKYHGMLEPGQGASGHANADDAHAHMHVHATMRYLNTLLGEKLMLILGHGDRYDGYSIRKGWAVVGEIRDPFQSMGMMLFGPQGIMQLLDR